VLFGYAVAQENDAERAVPHTRVEWSCSQLLQNTPLHPVAEWGRIRFGGADVPAEQRLADLESSLGPDWSPIDSGEGSGRHNHLIDKANMVFHILL
jgi:hypothetical protein